MTTQNLVICLSEARKSRGLPDVYPAPIKRDRAETTQRQQQTQELTSLFDGSLRERAGQIASAARDWNGREVMSPEELLPLLDSLVSDIRQDPGMFSRTGIGRLDRALSARFGDACLGRVALMTPQELLALDGVGQTSLDQVTSELSRHGVLSVPELVCGRGKAGLQEETDLPDCFFELAAGMPGH